MAASMDGAAWLYSASGHLLAVLRCDGGAGLGADFVRDGRWILTSHEDGAVRTWLVAPDDLLRHAEARLRELGARPSRAR